MPRIAIERRETPGGLLSGRKRWRASTVEAWLAERATGKGVLTHAAPLGVRCCVETPGCYPPVFGAVVLKPFSPNGVKNRARRCRAD
jgi:hypothetical protein